MVTAVLYFAGRGYDIFRPLLYDLCPCFGERGLPLYNAKDIDNLKEINMMQFSKWTMGAGMLLGTLLPVNAEAQVVKSERLLSFEEPQVPAFISGTGSRLGISREHYKDGLHSLSWTFDPGAVLSVKKDLKFEKKDPTGKDTYLSAFIVWVYNEEAQDKKSDLNF